MRGITHRRSDSAEVGAAAGEWMNHQPSRSWGHHQGIYNKQLQPTAAQQGSVRGRRMMAMEDWMRAQPGRPADDG